MKKYLVIGFLGGFGFFVLVFVVFSLFVTQNIDPKLEAIHHSDVIEKKFLRLKEPFQLIPLDNPNEKIKLSFSDTGIVVLNFWATWCGPCKAEMSDFQKLYNTEKKDVKFYFLSDELITKQSSVVQQQGWKMPFFKSDSLVRKKMTEALPTTYIIKNGIVFMKHEGQFRWDSPEVIDFLEQLK